MRPVDGWQAIRNDVSPNKVGGAYVESYVVLACPEFVLDPRFACEYLLYSKNDTAEYIKTRLELRKANQKHVSPQKEIP